MRTTLDLSDEAYALAKAIAQEQGLGLGRAISQIILNYANPPAPPAREIHLEHGIPVVSVGRVITSEEVQRILEESE